MTYTETRNRNINHLSEAAVVDFCKLYGAAYEIDEGVIIVSHIDESPWFLILPEFKENGFEVFIETFVYDSLPLSKSIKLREIYRADNIISFINNNKMLLRFHEDKHLLASYSFEWDYKNYALLKSKLILEIYTQLQNASEIRQELESILKEKEVVEAN